MTTVETLLHTFAEWRTTAAGKEPGLFAETLDRLLGYTKEAAHVVLFDGPWYLETNQLPAPARNPVRAALTHYLKTGADKGLDPTPWFSEADYRAAYPDVGHGIRTGAWRCGFQHYLLCGIAEKRSPSAAFNELAYLGHNTDVLGAVISQSALNGLLHYLWSGRAEGRSADPSPVAPLLDLPITRAPVQIEPSSAFAEALYLSANRDVIDPDRSAVGMRHWQSNGVNEDLRGTRPRLAEWVEGAYLDLNQDLGHHLGGNGQQPTGYSHFLMYGAAEGRPWPGGEWARLEAGILQDALTRRTPVPERTDGQAWPTISIIVPVYNPDQPALRACIQSVMDQTYPHWQLCLADDASTLPHVAETLALAAQADPRVCVTFAAGNGGISAASNNALAIASGEFIALLDHDDVLAPDALLHLAQAFLSRPDVDMVYTDEAKLTEAGEHVGLNAKPGWSPELLLSTMYIGHLTAYRRALVETAGGFRTLFDGTQDYDLALRMADLVRAVVHVPRPLYFWRMSAASTAGSMGAKPEAFRLQGRALESALVRRGQLGMVKPGHSPGHWTVRLNPPADTPLVSIVIPTAGNSAMIGERLVDLIVNTVHSLQRSETYPNIEVVIVHNKDLRPSTLAMLANFRHVRLVRSRSGPFSFSEMVNVGVEAAAGEFVLLLNDDMQAESPDIIGSMLSRMFDGVGIVGGRLLFSNGTLQHAGIVWGDDGPSHAMIFEHRMSAGPAQRLLVTHDVFAVTGACMFFRRALFQEAGGLSLHWPVNYNDVEFCVRIRALGHRIVFNPDVTLYHFESVSKSGTYFWELQQLVLAYPGLGDPYMNPAFDSSRPFYQLADRNAAKAPEYRAWLMARIDRRRFMRPSNQEKRFSFILSVYETPLKFLTELEATLLRQTYTNWELALVDNGCREPEVVAWLDRLSGHDQVVFVRLETNQGIMGGYGTAFRAATGDYVVPIDSDDLLTLDCLDVLAYHLEQADWPDATYSDEDKTDSRSHLHSPFLKPDWDPVLLTNICYIAHVCSIRRALAVEIGCYSDDAAAGCHDWDSFLRLIRAGARIRHVPELLYSWRIHAGSTASIETGNKPYTITSQKHVLDQHLRLTGKDQAFEIVQNELFPHNGIWRLLPLRQGLLPATLVIVASDDPRHTARFLGDLALALRPAALGIIVVGGPAALLSPAHLLQEVGQVLWPEGAPIHVATLSEALRGLPDDQVVSVVQADAGELSRDWLLEGIGLFRADGDVGAVGAEVVTPDGTVVWRGGFAGFGGAVGSPDFGKAVTDSGYHGIGWCQRTADAVPSSCFFARADLLRTAVGAAGEGASMRAVTGQLALAARQAGLRTIHTPFVRVTMARLAAVGPVLKPGEEAAFQQRPFYYSADFGSTLETAYRLTPFK